MATVVQPGSQPSGPPSRLRAVRPFRLSREAAERLMRAGVIPEGGRVQLLDGELVEFEVQGPSHRTSVGLAQDLFTALFAAGYFVQVQGPIALTDFSVPEPDVAVIRGRRQDFASGHPTVEHVVLLLEVADSTLAYDLGDKASLYASSGLPELWVLNLVDRQLEVLREPLPDASARYGWRYRVHGVVREGEAIAPLSAPHLSILVSDLLPELGPTTA